MTLSCTAEKPALQEPPKAAGQAAEPSLERPILEVRLAPAREGRQLRWRTETLGLATALLESGLADLQDVVPIVEGAAVAPGLGGAVKLGRQPWTAAVDVRDRKGEVQVLLSLCSPTGVCTSHEATAPQATLSAATGELLEATADVLGRPPAPGAAQSWKAPLSRDPYAVLLAGRAAATFYGLLPAPAPELVGDRRRDPIIRAVLVDPSIAVSQWIMGRRYLASGSAYAARTAFTRASLTQPHQLVFRADEAVAVTAMNLPDEAWRAWEAVQTRAPDQHRFAVQRARTLVKGRDFVEASELLAALPTFYEGDVAVIELWVAIAEAGGPAAPYDGLLARWQLADATDPEPIRRRIALRVKQQKFTEALAFTPSLRQRGAATEAARLDMSLGVATGDYELAAKMADSLDMPETAARIRARAALQQNPAAVPPELAKAQDAMARVIRATAQLKAGKATVALQEADAVLTDSPYMPEALAVRGEALRALGRHDDAARTTRALRFADPAWPGAAPAPAAVAVEAQAQSGTP